MGFQVVIDAVRVVLVVLIVATLVITPGLIRLAGDGGQQARFWGLSFLLFGAGVAQIQNFGTQMTWALPLVIVGVLSSAYGGFSMLYRNREGERRRR